VIAVLGGVICYFVCGVSPIDFIYPKPKPSVVAQPPKKLKPTKSNQSGVAQTTEELPVAYEPPIMEKPAVPIGDEQNSAPANKTFDENSLIDFEDYFKKQGFNSDTTESYVEFSRYGTRELRDKLRKADEFDKPDINSQIRSLLGEIKKKTFFVTVEIKDFSADEVGDIQSS
jgi:hypothetical protein